MEETNIELPRGWQEKVDDQGESYLYEVKTGKRIYAVPLKSTTDLEVKQGDDGYYYVLNNLCRTVARYREESNAYAWIEGYERAKAEIAKKEAG